MLRRSKDARRWGASEKAGGKVNSTTVIKKSQLKRGRPERKGTRASERAREREARERRGGSSSGGEPTCVVPPDTYASCFVALLLLVSWR